MNNLKIKLADNSEIAIEEFGYPLHVVAICANRKKRNKLWDTLDPGEPITFVIIQGGNPISTCRDVTVTDTQSVKNADGTLTAHFYFSGVSEPGDTTVQPEGGEIEQEAAEE